MRRKESGWRKLAGFVAAAGFVYAVVWSAGEYPEWWVPTLYTYMESLPLNIYQFLDIAMLLDNNGPFVYLSFVCSLCGCGCRVCAQT